jgi:Zn finger protein HypA/HybF involved in hydrogenase expression
MEPLNLSNNDKAEAERLNQKYSSGNFLLQIYQCRDCKKIWGVIDGNSKLCPYCRSKQIGILPNAEQREAFEKDFRDKSKSKQFIYCKKCKTLQILPDSKNKIWVQGCAGCEEELGSLDENDEIHISKNMIPWVTIPENKEFLEEDDELEENPFLNLCETLKYSICEFRLNNNDTFKAIVLTDFFETNFMMVQKLETNGKVPEKPKPTLININAISTIKLLEFGENPIKF